MVCQLERVQNMYVIRKTAFQTSHKLLTVSTAKCASQSPGAMILYPTFESIRELGRMFSQETFLALQGMAKGDRKLDLVHFVLCRCDVDISWLEELLEGMQAGGVYLYETCGHDERLKDQDR